MHFLLAVPNAERFLLQASAPWNSVRLNIYG
jgi:hypothetical protein